MQYVVTLLEIVKDALILPWGFGTNPECLPVCEETIYHLWRPKSGKWLNSHACRAMPPRRSVKKNRRISGSLVSLTHCSTLFFPQAPNPSDTRCLKITEKILFNIASEASYVYILSGQRLLKMPNMVHFGEFLKTWSLRSNSVTRKVNFNRTKLVENAKIKKLKCDILSDFQTMCPVAIK